MIKRFCAELNSGNFINVVADRMELKENMIYAYDGPELVALADISVILSARISDERNSK